MVQREHCHSNYDFFLFFCSYIHIVPRKPSKMRKLKEVSI
jgi:hypothetical protein